MESRHIPTPLNPICTPPIIHCSPPCSLFWIHRMPRGKTKRRAMKDVLVNFCLHTSSVLLIRQRSIPKQETHTYTHTHTHTHTYSQETSGFSAVLFPEWLFSADLTSWWIQTKITQLWDTNMLPDGEQDGWRDGGIVGLPPSLSLSLSLSPAYLFLLSGTSLYHNPGRIKPLLPPSLHLSLHPSCSLSLSHTH